MTKNLNEFIYVKDQEGFAVMKTKDQLEIGDTIISKEEYEEICGEIMTDKQIIIDKSKCKHYWNGNCSDWDNKLIGACDDFEDCYCKMYLRKEQECEELKIYIESNEQQVKEVETLVMDNDRLINELDKLKQTLAEIKPILEYYEDSKIGEKQEDGSYKLEFTFSDVITPYCIKYDPKPAREALRKINEVENEG